jgi:hypothetical protein
MKKIITNTIFLISVAALIFFYGYIFNQAFESQLIYERDQKRREYIRFQKDSLELELLKKNIK